MNAAGKQFEKRVPKAARYLNTAMALVLIGLGSYHFTRPDAAWRSGTMESVTALALLTAAWLVSPKVAVVINVIFTVLIVPLGIRHIAMGGGWISGSIELTFAVLLIVVAVIISNSSRKITKN